MKTYILDEAQRSRLMELLDGFANGASIREAQAILQSIAELDKPEMAQQRTNMAKTHNQLLIDMLIRLSKEVANVNGIGGTRDWLMAELNVIIAHAQDVAELDKAKALTDEDAEVIALKCCPGETSQIMKAIIPNGPIPVSQGENIRRHIVMALRYARDNGYLAPSAGKGLSVDEVIVLKDAASWWSSTSRTKQAARKRKEHAELVRAIAARLESAAKAKS